MLQNPEKIMLFLLPLVTFALFLTAIFSIWTLQNWGWLMQQLEPLFSSL
jgi:NhaP-type Na+/H+ or K+/H+ antiporter